MSSLKPGVVAELTADQEMPYGFFLTDGENRVLLHHSEMTEELQEGDTVTVFLYHDKEVRLAATMRIPKIQVGYYGWAEVVDKHEDLGVFVNIGLPKDILVSGDDLPKFFSLWPEPGDQLFMTLNRDKQDRLYGRLATENIIEQVARRASSEMNKASIQGRVYRLLRVGTFFLSEQGYRCFVHENERREEPRLGQMVEGRVIDVKEDGSLNVSFLPLKQDKMSDDAEIIFEYLLERNGSMPYWDKSLPDEIKDRFNMSKASFKRALGMMMKEGKIYQEDGWTYLKKD
ncbi:S1-like domain-containing RNA-binding protein [Rossellomorea marisflavi]|uniref:CvfB family protein n=1 Tax=Rossellomorea marisflavi TaxID=189381 RepID=UPI0025B1F9E7|nr:S1-like domain-containing RNA-binding protein [Rossellomorea marisflavi]WJV20927.1 S1-like domain-containing RNA-binding protein [Rossellomorea marisflavi]